MICGNRLDCILEKTLESCEASDCVQGSPGGVSVRMIDL